MKNLFKGLGVIIILLAINANTQPASIPSTIEWQAPFDSPLVHDSNTTIDVTVVIYGQDNAPLAGLNPDLTIDFSQAGNIVDQQNMADNGDGSYTISGVDFSGNSGDYFELELRVPLDGSMLRSRITYYYGADFAQALDVWKIAFVSPTSTSFLVSDSIDFTVEVYNDSGTLWAGQQVEITIRNAQNWDRIVDQVQMTDNGDGTYSYQMAAGTLPAGNNYVVEVETPNTNNNAETFMVIEVTLGPTVDLIPVASPTYERTPELTWHPLAGAGGYIIEIDTDPGFGNPTIVSPTADTSFTPLTDLPFGTIYWRVASDNNPTNFSDPGSFEIIDVTIPVIISYTPDPTLDNMPTLTWHSVAGASGYEIEIADNPGFNNAIVTTPVADTFYTPLVPLPEGRIFWRVRSDLNTTYSASDDFEILPPNTPILLTFNGDTVPDPRPQFTWNSIDSVEWYRIEISTDPQFNNIIISTPVGDTVYTPLVDLQDGEYFWRISSSLDPGLNSPVDNLVIVAGTTGIPPEYNSGLNAPNMYVKFSPSDNRIYLRHNLPDLMDLSLYDLDGKLVWKLDNPKTDNGINIDIPSGKYFLRAKHKQGVISRAFIVVR
jgi:hypothetical protein